MQLGPDFYVVNKKFIAHTCNYTYKLLKQRKKSKLLRIVWEEAKLSDSGSLCSGFCKVSLPGT